MRRLIIKIHLWLAAFMMPVFLLLALSGGLYLIGEEGTTQRTDISVPADAVLDFSEDNREASARAFFAAQEISYAFDYARGRADSFITRPTSRTYYAFAKTGDTFTVTRHEPDLQRVMIELHKGHGPSIFRDFQKLVALALIFVVLSGAWLGFASRILRKESFIVSGVGLIVFIATAFFL